MFCINIQTILTEPFIHRWLRMSFKKNQKFCQLVSGSTRLKKNHKFSPHPPPLSFRALVVQLAIKPYQIAPFVRERARLTAVIVSERWRGAMTISRRKPRPRRRWRCLAWCGVRTYIRLARRELEMQLQSRLLAHLVSHSPRRPRALDHVSPPASKRKWCHLCTTPPNSLILSLTFRLPETCHKVWAPFVSGSEQIFFFLFFAEKLGEAGMLTYCERIL